MTVSSHLLTAWAGSQELQVTDATVTFDETWSPYVQGSLTASLKNVDLTKIDPYSDARLQITMQQDFGRSDTVAVLTTQFGGHNVAYNTTAWTSHNLAWISAQHFYPYVGATVTGSTIRRLDVGIRSRVLDHDANTVTIEFASDEALLQDYALVDFANYNPNISDVRTIVGRVLTRIGGYLQAGTVTGIVSVAASTWIPGQTAEEYLTPLLQAAQARLYCDEQRRWYLVRSDYEAGGSISLSYTSTITQGTDNVARDNPYWADSVVIRYEYTDSAGATTIMFDAAQTPGYSKTLHLTYNTPYPGPGAAQVVLNRITNRAKNLEINAVSNYTASPGQTATIELPVTGTETATIKAVTWNYPADEMQIKATRAA